MSVPEFDPGALRWAVRRGVLRTAVVTALLALVAYWLLFLLLALWKGHYRSDIERVVGIGLMVSNPAYDSDAWGCCNAGLISQEYRATMTPRTASQLASPVELRVSTNLFGRVDNGQRPNLPETPVIRALDRRPSKAETRELLDGLPGAVVATAIVELAEPMRNDEWEDFLRRHGRSLSPDFLDVPPILLQPVYRRERFQGPVGWPEPPSVPLRQLPTRKVGDGIAVSEARELGDADDDSLAQFKEWAEELDDGDDVNLERIWLPPSRELKRIARDPRVHGFILERATLADLRGYLDDPAVRTVDLADVAFDLDPKLR